MNNDVASIIGIDRVVHEPVRLAIMLVLAAGYSADFAFLKNYLAVTDGNLAAHLRALEEAGYIASEKEFVARKPHTTYVATESGSAALRSYAATLVESLSQHTRAGAAKP